MEFIRTRISDVVAVRPRVFEDERGYFTETYAPEHERTLRWDDAGVGIEWPLPPGLAPILSDRDRAAPGLHAVETDS